MHADNTVTRTTDQTAPKPRRRKPNAEEVRQFAKARAERDAAIRLAREERQAKTRTYRLGKAVETVLFEQPRWRKEIEAIIRGIPKSHVYEAFRFSRSMPSWFDNPEEDGSPRHVDIRRFSLGGAVEQLLHRRVRGTLRARLRRAAANETERVQQLLEPMLRPRRARPRMLR